MNNRVLGIIGASLLIVGIFMPIVSVMGFISFSYFNLFQMASGTFFTGIILLLLGIGSLTLALQYKFKPLIATGAVALALLAFDLYRFKSGLSNAASSGSEAGGEMGADLARQMADAISLGFGFYLLIIGAIALIVACVMKNSIPDRPQSWNPPPPPYPPVG